VPADETTDDKNTRRERNRKRSERRKHLRETFPIPNLTEALDQVVNRVHTTPEQCLMSITTIARHAQGVRVGEVIAKLAEDAYFMRVNNRVSQVPPLRTHEPKHHEATSHSPADGGCNLSREEQPHNPNRSRASAGGPSRAATARAAPAEAATVLVVVMVATGAAAVGDHHMALAGQLVVTAITEVEATRTTTSPATHMAATMPATELKRFVVERLLKQVTATASSPSPLDFMTYFSQRNSSLLGLPSTTRSKTQFSGLGAVHYPLKTPVATPTRSASTSPSA
jgi:hypothetical protein